MTVVLHLLPLLVVGCLLLQSLQLTAAVRLSGQKRGRDDEEVCDQTIEGEESEAITYTERPHADELVEIQEATKAQKNEADERLTNDFKDCKKKELTEHMPFTIDDSKTTDAKYLRDLCQDGYVIRYSTKRRTPLFTAERLDGPTLSKTQLDRKKNTYFRPDPRLDTTSESSECASYKHSGYDRGHLAPSADMTSDVSQTNSFILSNMAPQFPDHNRFAWKNWEAYTRKKAEDKKFLLVITGVTGEAGKIHNKLIIPEHWYKLLVWCENGVLQAEYIFTDHKNTKTPATQWGSTIITGLTSINGVTAALKNVQEVESFIEGKTQIDFKISSSKLCEGSVPVAEGLNQLSQSTSSSSVSLQDSGQATASSSFCKKMKTKFHKLQRMGKLSRCSRKKEKVGKNLLDLGKGYFSAGCRKASHLVLHDYIDDTEQMISNEQAFGCAAVQAVTKPVTGYVSKGQTLRLFDLLDVAQKKRLSAINIRLQKIVSNCEAKFLDIYTAPSQKFTFVPGVFSVRSAVFSVRISYGKDNRNVIAGVTGQWAIGNIVLDVLARYDINSMKLLLRGAPKIKLSINLQNELNSLTGTYVPIPLPSVTLSNIAVTGQFDLIKGGLATVVVSGSIGKNRVHAVFQKPVKGGKFSGAFASDFGPIKLSNIIKKTTKVDISRVPFFGSLVIPRLGVTVSSDYITSSLIPKILCKNSLLQNTGVSIPKGLQVFTILNLKGTKVPLKIYYYKSYLSFKVIRNGRLTIGALLSTIPGVNIRSHSLPPGLRDALRFRTVFFSLDTNSKQMVVETKFPGTLHYFNGYLTITKPEVKVIAALKQPRKVDFEVDGAVRIGNGDYSITISRDPSFANKYVVKASFKTIPISDFIKKFSAAVLPRGFQATLKKFVQFSIHNAKLAFPLGTRNLQLHLSGTPVISGYKTVHMSAIIIKQGGKNKLAAGFQLGKVKLATLIYKITRKNLQGIAILNQELDTSLVISPVSLPGVHLYGSKLKHINIIKGVSLHALLQWPSNCARDKFCVIAQRVLGRKAKFSLQASIASASSFTLSAGVSNVRLGAGVVLQRAALQIMVGIENSVGIEGSIHLNKYGITLSAGIRVGSRGVVLEGNMQGCWKRAFGADWLTICNLHLLIGIQPTVTLIGALEIGGEVRIGKPSCIRRPLIAKGYMGIDQLSPNNNFYYVQLKNRVTMGTLLQAFCIRFHLPRPLANSGFPRGFLSSFSPIGKSLPKAGIDIPAGYRIKGTINILGLEAHADVTINHRNVKMNIALSKLNIARGLIQMYASRRDRSRGPFLKVFVTAIPRHKVDIHASVFASVLGIQREAMLRITNTKYEFRIAGRFLHLFHASLHITANYGNIKNAGFRVRGHLSSDFFAVIRSKIQNGLRSSSRAATRAIDSAKRSVNSKKVYFDRAIGKLRSAQHRVNRARHAFNRAMNKLRQWEHKVRRLCSIRRCHSVCIGCPGPWRCWKSVSIWGRRRCVLKKPTWRRCCRRITNPVCIARNVACHAVRRTAILGLRGARYLVGKSRGILNAASAVLRGAQHVVRISKRSLDIVNAALEGVKRAYQAGTRALSAVVRFGLGGVFDITELSFDVALSSAARGHFRVSTVVKIFGHYRRFGININLRNVLSFVKAIGNKVIGGLRKFIS